MSIAAELEKISKLIIEEKKEIAVGLEKLKVASNNASKDITLLWENFKKIKIQKDKTLTKKKTDETVYQSYFKHLNQIFARIRKYDTDVPSEKRLGQALVENDNKIQQIAQEAADLQMFLYKGFFEATRPSVSKKVAFDVDLTKVTTLEVESKMNLSVSVSKGAALYSTIKEKYSKYFGLKENKLEEKRALLFELRDHVQEWLKKHSKEKTGTGSKQEKQRLEILTLNQVIKSDLRAIGIYAIARDNYLKIKDLWSKLNSTIQSGTVDWKEEKAPEKEPDNEKLTRENRNKRRKEEIEAFQKEGADLAVEISEWLKRHKDDPAIFSITKKRREMMDMLRIIARFVQSQGIELALTKESNELLSKGWGLKVYIKNKDELYSKVKELKEDVERFDEDALSGKERFHVLGDFNMAIGEWKYEAGKYHPDENLESAQKEVAEGERLMEEKYNAVTAYLTLKRLYKVYKKIKNKFDGKKKKKSPKEYPKLIEQAEEMLEFIKEWESQYQKLDQSVKDNFTDQWAELIEAKTDLQRYSFGESSGHDAVLLYRRIVKLYEDGDFRFNEELSYPDKEEKRNYIMDVLKLIKQWEGMVEKVKGGDLEEAKTGLAIYREDLLEEFKKLLGKVDTKDELFDRIKREEKLYNSFTKGSVGQKEIIIYVRKLADYWLDENPYVIPSKKAAEKTINQILQKFEKDEKGGAFLKIELHLGVTKSADQLGRRYEDTLKAIKEREKNMKARDVFNKNVPSFKPREEVDKVLNDFLEEQKKELVKVRNEQIETGKYKDAYAIILELNEALTAKIKKTEFDLHEKCRKAEQIVFSTFGDLDYDYLHSGKYSDEEIALMNATLEDITDRAIIVLEAAKRDSEIPTGIVEAEKMFSHIPVFIWPDRFVKELHAFKKVHEALEKEAREEVNETVKKQLEEEGLLEVLADAGKGTLDSVKKFSTALNDANRKSWYKEKDESGEKITISGFTGDPQKEAEKTFGNVISEFNFSTGIATNILGIAVSVKDQTKTKEERAKAVTLIAMKTTADILNNVSARKTIDNKEFKVVCRAIGTVLGLIVSSVETYDKNKVKDLSDIAANTQKQIDKNISKFEDVAKSLLTMGIGVAKAVEIFTSIPAQVVPVLGIVSGTISIGINIRKIAKDVIKEEKTYRLKSDAYKEGTYDYLGPLQQEIDSLDKRIMKRTIDTYGDVVNVAGGIADATVIGVPAGAVLKVMAGVIKFGNEIVFTSINEASLGKARNLLKKAKAGDRQAMEDIMGQSPRYAKMFLAMGAVETPPHPISLEFVRQRGLTERDLKKDHVSASYLRKFLLDDAEEADSDGGKIGAVKDWAKRLETWHQKVKLQQGFWKEESYDRSFKRLREVYTINQINRLITDYKNCNVILGQHKILTASMAFSGIPGMAVIGITAIYKPASKKMKEIFQLFTQHKVRVEKGIKNQEKVLREEEQKDKLAKPSRPEIKLAINRIKDEISMLNNELTDINDILKAFDKLPKELRED